MIYNCTTGTCVYWARIDATDNSYYRVADFERLRLFYIRAMIRALNNDGYYMLEEPLVQCSIELPYDPMEPRYYADMRLEARYAPLHREGYRGTT